MTVDGTLAGANTSSTSDKPSDKTLRDVPPPPDHGAVAYVLRTGFSSSQGALLQMIEFSQQSVSGDNWETGLALLILFVFALMASAYVLKGTFITRSLLILSFISPSCPILVPL